VRFADRQLRTRDLIYALSDRVPLAIGDQVERCVDAAAAAAAAYSEDDGRLWGLGSAKR
jgi:hypothetical protein